MQYIEAQEATLQEVPQHIRDHYNQMFKEMKGQRDQIKAQAQTNKEAK